MKAGEHDNNNNQQDVVRLTWPFSIPRHLHASVALPRLGAQSVVVVLLLNYHQIVYYPWCEQLFKLLDLVGVDPFLVEAGTGVHRHVLARGTLARAPRDDTGELAVGGDERATRVTVARRLGGVEGTDHTVLDDVHLAPLVVALLVLHNLHRTLLQIFGQVLAVAIGQTPAVDGHLLAIGQLALLDRDNGGVVGGRESLGQNQNRDIVVDGVRVILGVLTDLLDVQVSVGRR